MPVAFYIEVVVNDQGDADISVLCDDPQRETYSECAEVLAAAALELRDMAANELH